MEKHEKLEKNADRSGSSHEQYNSQSTVYLAVEGSQCTPAFLCNAEQLVFHCNTSTKTNVLLVAHGEMRIKSVLHGHVLVQEPKHQRHHELMLLIMNESQIMTCQVMYDTQCTRKATVMYNVIVHYDRPFSQNSF